jgi:hypothetical protein
LICTFRSLPQILRSPFPQIDLFPGPRPYPHLFFLRCLSPSQQLHLPIPLSDPSERSLELSPTLYDQQNELPALFPTREQESGSRDDSRTWPVPILLTGPVYHRVSKLISPVRFSVPSKTFPEPSSTLYEVQNELSVPFSSPKTGRGSSDDSRTSPVPVLLTGPVHHHVSNLISPVRFSVPQKLFQSHPRSYTKCKTNCPHLFLPPKQEGDPQMNPGLGLCPSF